MIRGEERSARVRFGGELQSMFDIWGWGWEGCAGACSWKVVERDMNGSQQLGLIIQFRSERKQFQIDSMLRTRSSLLTTSYLDVSQFIIKEHSPLMKPTSPQHHHHPHVTFFQFVHIFLRNCLALLIFNNTIAQICVLPFLLFKMTQAHAHQETPELPPIDHDPSQFTLTPLAAPLLPTQIADNLEDFVLDSGSDAAQETRPGGRRRKGRTWEARSSLCLQMFRLDNELERIIEDNDESSNCFECESSEGESSEEGDQEDLGCTVSSCALSSWAFKSKSRDYSLKDTEEERQSTIDLSIVDYSQTIDRFTKSPKTEILRRLREIEHLPDLDEEQKKLMMKKHLEKYILDYETFCFQEAWKDLEDDLSTMVADLSAGLQETFSKRVGVLSFQNRRVKLLKYLQKKKRRIWRKKVSYDCRKKVADGRLRIKGKFVTREQACEQLGLQSLDNYSAEQIKEMLQRRIDESLNQQLVC